LDLAGGAGRTRGYRDPLQVERNDRGFRLHGGNSKKRRVRQALRFGTEDDQLGRLRPKTGFEPFAQKQEVSPFRLEAS